MANLSEGAVSVVVTQEAGCPLEHARNAIKMFAQLVVATGEMLLLPIIDKAAGEQIEPTVVVEIEPDCASGPMPVEDRCSQTGFVADVGKGAIAVVVIQNRPAVSGHEKIGISIVVIVAHGDAHSESIRRDAGFLGYVGECAIAVVLVQCAARVN